MNHVEYPDSGCCILIILIIYINPGGVHLDSVVDYLHVRDRRPAACQIWHVSFKRHHITPFFPPPPSTILPAAVVVVKPPGECPRGECPRSGQASSTATTTQPHSHATATRRHDHDTTTATSSTTSTTATSHHINHDHHDHHVPRRRSQLAPPLIEGCWRHRGGFR